MKEPYPLAYKPDLSDAARRWEAYYRGEMIDRPIVCVSAPKDPSKQVKGSTYREKQFGDLDDIISRALEAAENTYYGGESIPAFGPSFGCDEVAVFTVMGAKFAWSDESGDTCWSEPCVDDWGSSPPITLKRDHPLWQRMLTFYRKAADRMAGKMLLTPLDLHTNMDMLLALRGSERLCMDCIEQPRMIDRAMADARRVFREVWSATAKAGRMDEFGYCNCMYSMEGASFLQCDFSCMISPAMFRRWVLPALEEEASIVKHVVYHWDGPGALVHTADLLASKGLHTMSYVPGAGHGSHVEHLDLLKRVQAGGKAVQVWGTPDEMKQLHRELKPERVIYCTNTKTPAEADDLLKWFVKNT